MGALEALTDDDLERSSLHFHPEFEMVDHRTIGWGITDREAVIERTKTIRELTADATFYAPRLELGSHPVASLSEYCLRGTTELGAAVEQRSFLVNENDLATGLIVRSARFDVDKRVAADERMAEIEAAAAHDLVRPNNAVIVSGAANVFALTGRHEQFVDRFSDDLLISCPMAGRSRRSTCDPLGDARGAWLRTRRA